MLRLPPMEINRDKVDPYQQTICTIPDGIMDPKWLQVFIIGGLQWAFSLNWLYKQK
jgi:hypothetical protein